MKRFLETRFGPTELGIVEDVFSSWMDKAKLDKASPEAELVAAIMFNLFREGHVTVPDLRLAADNHRALMDLGGMADIPDQPTSREAP